MTYFKFKKAYYCCNGIGYCMDVLKIATGIFVLTFYIHPSRNEKSGCYLILPFLNANGDTSKTFLKKWLKA